MTMGRFGLKTFILNEVETSEISRVLSSGTLVSSSQGGWQDESGREREGANDLLDFLGNL